MNIIIPTLGGNGGFKIPRYLIKINSEYVIENIINNLDLNAKIIFIISIKDKIIFGAHKILKKIKPDCEIIIAERKTKGILQTLLLAEKYLNKKKLIISNCDHFIDFNKKDLLNVIKNNNNFGCILTYFPKDDSHCFLKCNGKYVVHAAERRKISNVAAAGVYYIRSGLDFKKYLKKVIKKRIKYNNMYYISSVYNEIIKDNKKIVHLKTRKMAPLGSIDELNKFIKKNNFKYSNLFNLF